MGRERLIGNTETKRTSFLGIGSMVDKIRNVDLKWKIAGLTGLGIVGSFVLAEVLYPPIALAGIGILLVGVYAYTRWTNGLSIAP